MKRFALILAMLTVVLPAACFAGPFGFDYGMTKDQVIAIVGSKNVIKNKDFLLQVAAAPKPDDNFEVYLLLISPEKGLLKIIATGKTLETSGDGTELRVYFGAMRDVLARKYGPPTKSHDFLQPDSKLDAPGAFTESLRLKQRVLACNWDVTAEKRKSVGAEADHIIGVILQAKGLRRTAAWLELTYEFEGFSAFYEQEVNKKTEQVKKH
jgi:hypothetical protein